MELSGADATTIVQVKTVEGLVGVESWVGSKSLSEGLGSVLNSDVSSPHGSVLIGSVWKEAVISSWASWVWIVGWSSLNHRGVVVVLGKESILELSDVDSSVSRVVVSGDEKINLIHGWVDTNGVESRLELIRRNLTVSVGIENVEGVRNVEVALEGELDLGRLKLLLEVAEILEGVDELVLIVWSQDWLSGWGGSNWRSSSGWGRVSQSSGSRGRHSSSWGRALQWRGGSVSSS